MEGSVLNSGCVDGCGGSTWTSKLILSRFAMEKAEAVEKLKIRRSGRRCFFAKNFLQIYGLWTDWSISLCDLVLNKFFEWYKSK